MSDKMLVWLNEYELGIEEIDLQHHYFLNLINRLEKELANSDDLVYQQSLFKELSIYAHFHFVSEENFMYREGYPDLTRHKSHHDALIAKLNRKKLQFETGQIKATSIIDFLRHWFLQHTIGEDMKFAKFFR